MHDLVRLLVGRFGAHDRRIRKAAAFDHFAKYGSDVTQESTDAWIDEAHGVGLAAQARADAAHARIDNLAPGGGGDRVELGWLGDQVTFDGVASGPHLTGPKGDKGDRGDPGPAGGADDPILQDVRDYWDEYKQRTDANEDALDAEIQERNRLNAQERADREAGDQAVKIWASAAFAPLPDFNALRLEVSNARAPFASLKGRLDDLASKITANSEALSSKASQQAVELATAAAQSAKNTADAAQASVNVQKGRIDAVVAEVAQARGGMTSLDARLGVLADIVTDYSRWKPTVVSSLTSLSDRITSANGRIDSVAEVTGDYSRWKPTVVSSIVSLSDRITSVAAVTSDYSKWKPTVVSSITSLSGRITTAQNTANSAQSSANTARDRADAAQSTANTARSRADTALDQIVDIKNRLAAGGL